MLQTWEYRGWGPTTDANQQEKFMNERRKTYRFKQYERKKSEFINIVTKEDMEQHGTEKHEDKGLWSGGEMPPSKVYKRQSLTLLARWSTSDLSQQLHQSVSNTDTWVCVYLSTCFHDHPVGQQ